MRRKQFLLGMLGLAASAGCAPPSGGSAPVGSMSSVAELPAAAEVIAAWEQLRPGYALYVHKVPEVTSARDLSLKALCVGLIFFEQTEIDSLGGPESARRAMRADAATISAALGIRETRTVSDPEIYLPYQLETPDALLFVRESTAERLGVNRAHQLTKVVFVAEHAPQ